MRGFRLAVKKLASFRICLARCPNQTTRRMKKTLLVTILGLTTTATSLFAQTTQTLSIAGPSGWLAGTSVTLSVFDTFSGFGGGSYGLSYWLEVSNSFAPFLAITGLTYFTFTDGNNIGTFPFSFNSTSGADSGFMTTTTADGQSGDLGGTSQTLTLVPDGTYHITDITFFLAAGAPPGSFTLRTTTVNPRSSIQVTSDFNDAPFPAASFIVAHIPEPSTVALMVSAGVGAGALAYPRRKS